MTLNIANLDRLISHLEGLPEERFNMGFVSRERDCGTVACIAGWCDILGNKPYGADEFLGLSEDTRALKKLFMPTNWQNDAEGGRSYPLSRAIRTLKHMRSEFLRTGQVVVDWDAPAPAARKDWVAPQAVERVLPAEITKLLTPTVRAEVL